jgi:hypothetical protein
MSNSTINLALKDSLSCNNIIDKESLPKEIRHKLKLIEKAFH